LPEVPGYEIVAELGRGGMGVVYKARHTGLNRTVALKMIGVGTAANPDLLDRFRSEAEVIARLQQPNIIQVYDIGTSPGGPYFAMEYAEGGSLADRWAGAPQATRFAAQTVAALAVAVEAAHEQGIIHRDIKPANILLAYVSGSQTAGKGGKRSPGGDGRRHDRELVPKISDFGLARRIGETRGRTVTGQVMGTPGYMAPEQARGAAEDVGPAADVYALGVLLYEALTGGPPYRGVSGLESVHLMLSAEPMPPSRLRPGLPRDLDTICLHCLQKEPHKRYPSAGELADDLERFLAGEPIKARPTPAWERTWKWSRRHPATAALAVALALTVAVGFVLVLGQWRRAEAERDRTDKARREAVEFAASEAQAKHRAEVLSADLLLERGVSLCEAGDYGPGLLWLARALEAAPANDTRLKRSARLLMGGWGRQLRLPRAAFPHDNEMEAAVLSRDGRHVAAAGGNLVYVWETDTGKRCGVPLVHPAAINAVVFSPDGTTLLTASRDGTARLWDAATGQPRGEPLRHAARVDVAQFSPDGSVAMSAGEDGTARLWDAATGRPIGEPLVHGRPVLAAAFSPDGKLLATAGEDGLVVLWDVGNRSRRGEPLRHGAAVGALAFSPDGRTLATGGDDKQARLWDAATGRLLHRLADHTARIRALAFSPDGQTLATGGDDHTAIMWDLNLGTPRTRLPHHDRVSQVVFSPGGKALATGCGDYTARLWTADTGRPLGGPLPHQGDLCAVVFGPGGGTLMTAGDDGMVRLWSTEPPAVPDGELVQEANVVGLAVSPDGRSLLTTDEHGVTRLWDVATGKDRVVAADTLATVVAFSPDGKTFLTAGTDPAVRFWDAASGAPAGPPLVHRANVISAAFSPDGRLVVTGTDDGDNSVRVWDRARGELLHTLTGHTRRVGSVAFGDGGRLVVSGSWDKTARLWDVTCGKPVGEALRHQDLVKAVAFSRDGKAVLTGGDDFTARLWGVPAGKLLGPPLRHTEKVESVAFSPDGTVLLTVGTGGRARLWDAGTGKPLGPALPQRGGLAAAAFSPDGRTFRTGGRGGVVERWTVPTPLDGNATVIQVWLHAHTGLQLDASGAVEALDPKVWHESFVRTREPR
jgi:WD40 repeat protein